MSGRCDSGRCDSGWAAVGSRLHEYTAHALHVRQVVGGGGSYSCRGWRWDRRWEELVQGVEVGQAVGAARAGGWRWGRRWELLVQGVEVWQAVRCGAGAEVGRAGWTCGAVQVWR